MNIRDMSPEERRAFARKGGLACQHKQVMPLARCKAAGKEGGKTAHRNGLKRVKAGLPYRKSPTF